MDDHFTGISAGQTQESLYPALNFPHHRIIITFLHFLAQALDDSISFKNYFLRHLVSSWHPFPHQGGYTFH